MHATIDTCMHGRFYIIIIALTYWEHYVSKLNVMHISIGASCRQSLIIDLVAIVSLGIMTDKLNQAIL